jgi:NADH-quinone oxidoreductase subunit A
MLLTYLAVLIMVGFVIVLGTAVLVMSALMRPKNPYRQKLTPWECGMEPVGEASEGHFFLFPWAVILTDKSISVLIFVEMVVFIVVLAVGLVYAWAKGALEWV